MEQTKSKLQKAINASFDNFHSVEAGSDNESRSAETLVELIEAQSKIEQSERDKKDKKIEHILTGIGIGAPLLVYTGLFFVGLNYEKTGTYTSQGMKNLFGKIKFK